MALDADQLAKLMLVTSTAAGPSGLDEFQCYAAGVVQGLKASTANVQTTGVAGSPGSAKGIGAIQPGAIAMVPFLSSALVGSMPPPGGAPTPLLPLFYLAICQIATHVLTNLEVEASPTDTIAQGVGLIPPGGFNVSGSVIEPLIIAEYTKKGLKPTPLRLSMAKAIGTATEQLMKIATMPSLTISGGVPSSPSSPAVGTRVGVIS